MGPMLRLSGQVRLAREAQIRKNGRGAKTSFILLEAIRCQIDLAASPCPAASFTPPSGGSPVFSAEL